MDMNELLTQYNDLHRNIKLLQDKDPEQFEASGFSACGHCNGTGLRGGKDINFACKSCHGVGFVGFTELNGETVCPDCNSTGKQLEYQNHVTDCKTCDGFGRLTWVDAIRKGISLEKLGW